MFFGGGGGRGGQNRAPTKVKATQKGL